MQNNPALKMIYLERTLNSIFFAWLRQVETVIKHLDRLTSLNTSISLLLLLHGRSSGRNKQFSVLVLKLNIPKVSQAAATKLRVSWSS